MDDGLRLEYTEGIATLKLELRTNAFDDHERAIVNEWMDFCSKLWNEKNLDHAIKKVRAE